MWGRNTAYVPIPPGRQVAPNGLMATWGKIALEQLNKDEAQRFGEGKRPEAGYYIDFLGNFARSAREGLPIFRIAGGAGFVWVASFDQKGRGVLRFGAVDATAYLPKIVDNILLSDERLMARCDEVAANAADNYRKASGVPFEQINPGIAIAACEEAVKRNPEESRLTYQLARSYLKANRFADALTFYRKAAARNYAAAQNDLGYMYERGLGVQKDLSEAVSWTFKAAQNGDRNAQFSLGVAYENGQGVRRDLGEAALWYRKAAKLGFQDGVNAVRKMAESGIVTAQLSLGRMYESGEGMPASDNQAAFWYRKAAEQGDGDAVASLERLLPRSDPPKPPPLISDTRSVSPENISANPNHTVTLRAYGSEWIIFAAIMSVVASVVAVFSMVFVWRARSAAAPVAFLNADGALVSELIRPAGNELSQLRVAYVRYSRISFLFLVAFISCVPLLGLFLPQAIAVIDVSGVSAPHFGSLSAVA